MHELGKIPDPMNLESHKKSFSIGRKNNRYPDVMIGAFIVLATLTVYWQLSTFDFIGYDDDKYITQNYYIQKNLLRLKL